MEQIIAKYNPTVIVDSPRYVWYVKNDEGENLFHCDYKNGILTIKMKDLMGATVFNKQVVESKIEDSIKFCQSYLAQYNSLSL